MVTGLIERGRVRTGDGVEILGGRGSATPRGAVVTDIEQFRRPTDEAVAGENVGLLLRGVELDEVERGHVLAAPRSLVTSATFRAEVYVLRKEEGERHTPFFSGYRPQFFFRTSDVTGVTKLPGGVEMVMPGDTVTVEVELGEPVAIEPRLRFAIREGGRTVGSGVVTEVLG